MNNQPSTSERWCKTRKHLDYHEGSAIVLDGEQVLVDIRIQPFIKWLNSFTGISTISSCEGDLELGGRTPYVMFHCSDESVLAQIIYLYEEFVVLYELMRNKDHVSYQDYVMDTRIGWFENKLAYTLMFGSMAAVDAFVQLAPDYGVVPDDELA